MASLPQGPDVEQARKGTRKEQHLEPSTQRSDLTSELDEGRKDQGGVQGPAQEEHTKEKIRQEEAQKALCREKLIKLHASMFQLASNWKLPTDPTVRRVSEVECLTELGEAVEALSGTMSREERTRLLEDLQSNVYQCVSSNPELQEDTQEIISQEEAQKWQVLCREKIIKVHASMCQLVSSNRENPTSSSFRVDGILFPQIERDQKLANPTKLTARKAGHIKCLIELGEAVEALSHMMSKEEKKRMLEGIQSNVSQSVSPNPQKQEHKEQIIILEEPLKWQVLCREKIIEVHASMFQLASNWDPTNTDVYKFYEIKCLKALEEAAEALSHMMSTEERRRLQHGILLNRFQCHSSKPSLSELQGLQRMLDATNGYVRRIQRLPFMPGYAGDDTNAEDRENEKQRFLSAREMMLGVLEFCDMTLKDETSLCQRLGDLNAGVALLLAATRDNGSGNFAAAAQAIVFIVCRLPEGNEIPLLDRPDLYSDVEALREAVLLIVQSLLHGEDVKPAIEQYIQVVDKLTFVLGHTENEKISDEIDKYMTSVYDETEKLLTVVQAVAAECGLRGEGELVAAGADVSHAAHALLNAVQITASTIHTPQCKRVVVQLAKDLESILDNVTKMAVDLMVSPEEYQQMLEHSKKAAVMNLQSLLVDVQSQGESSTNKQVRKRQKIHKTSYDHTLRLNKAKKAYNDITKLLLSVYEVAVTRGGEAQEDLYWRADSLTNRAQELFITAQLFALTSDAAEFKDQVQFIQNLAPALDDVVRVMFDGWAEPPEHIIKKAKEQKKVVDKSLEFLLDVQNTFEGGDQASSAKQEEIKEEAVFDSRVDKVKLKNLATKVHEEIETLLTIVRQVTTWQEDPDSELTTEGSNIAHLAEDLPNYITTDYIAKCKRVVHLLAKYLMVALDNLDVLMTTTWREDLRNQFDERRKMAGNFLISLMDALQSKSALNAKQYGKKEVHVENLQTPHLETYDYFEKARKLMIIFDETNGVSGPHFNHDEYSVVHQFITDSFNGTLTLEHGGKSLKDMLTAFCTVYNTTEPPSKMDFRQPLGQRLQCMNAAFAKLLAAVRDNYAPNYAAAVQALTDMTKILADIVIGTKYVWKSFIQERGEIPDGIQSIYKVCRVIRSFCINIDSEKHNAYHLTALYSEASGYLMHDLYPNLPGIPWSIRRRFEVDPTCGAAMTLLAHVFSVCARGVGGGNLFLKGAEVAAAVQELLTSAQLIVVTTPESASKEVVVQYVQELSSALRMLDQEWLNTQQDINITQEDIVKYSEMKSKVENYIDVLSTALALGKPTRGMVFDKPTTIFQNIRHLEVCLHLYYVKQTIKNAVMDIEKLSPSMPVESTVDKVLAASIGDKIVSLNGAVVVLYRLNNNIHDIHKCRLIERKENHSKALSCLNGIQVYMPQIISEDAVLQYATAASLVMLAYPPSTISEAHENHQEVLMQANAVFRLASRICKASSERSNPQAVTELAERARKAADTFLTTAQCSFAGLVPKSSKDALRFATKDLSDAISALGRLMLQDQLPEFCAAVDRLLQSVERLDDDLYTKDYSKNI